MSIRLTQLVWNTSFDLTMTEKFVLLCLANFANDHDNLRCCPSYKTLAKKCNMTKRHTKKIINQLCQQEVIFRQQADSSEGDLMSNNYHFNEELLKEGDGGGVLGTPPSDPGTPGWCPRNTTGGVLGTPNKYIL